MTRSYKRLMWSPRLGLRKPLMWLLKPRWKQSGTRVVCLHEIDDTKLFYKKMVWLKSNYNIIKMDDLTDLEFNAPRVGHNVVLTFDDCFASWKTNAITILKAMEIPATFFIPSGRITRTDRTAADVEMFRVTTRNLRRAIIGPSLTQQEVQSIANDLLFTIGSHTIHHVDVRDCRFKTDYDAEICGDREYLRHLTGQWIRYFAFPYGMPKNCPWSATLYCMKLGFKKVFSTIPGWVGQEYVIGRDCLSIEDPEWYWKARLGGSYDWLYRRLHK